MQYMAISDVVDIFNASSGTWSTAQLQQGRWRLAAASLPNVAFFAGGSFSFCTSNTDHQIRS
jgi:hypothetical protein